MILKNKKLLVITSLLILLPIPVGLLLWNRFPENSHLEWFLWMPGFMLAIHWLCILFTAKDPGNKDRNRKPLSLVLWIVPLVCNLSFGGIYALTLEVEFSPVFWTMVPMGLLFAAIGNYLPKTRMNATLGIKIPWTYSSEANWAATHRFAGKIWVIGGLAMIPAGFLPYLWAVGVMFADLLILCAVPVVYSWRYYQHEKSEGKELTPGYSPVMDKKTRKVSAVFLVLLVIILGFVLFRGEIEYVFYDEYLMVDTNMYSDHFLHYDVIESVEYREGNVPGLRLGGYGSFRLLMGYFESEEFGTYIRYTYYKPDACVVVKLQNQVLVLSGKDIPQTQALYDGLLKKIS